MLRVLAAAGAAGLLAAGACPALGEERQPLPRWEIGALAFGVSQPAYPGSDTQLTRGLAVPYLIYRGAVLRADGETAGLRAIKTERFELDVGFAGAFGSRAGEVPARAGMPRLGTLVEFGPRLKWRLTAPGQVVLGGRWTFELPLRGVFDLDHGLRHRGSTLEPEIGVETRLAGGLNLGFTASAILGDRQLADTFYGVAPAYATAARPAYAAQAGLVAWRLGASLSRPIAPDWRVFGFARVDSVSGAANAASPLVRRTVAPTVGVGLTWTWMRSATAGAE